MPCYHPIPAYYSKHVNEETQKRSLVFNQKEANDDKVVKIPCGNCIGCRLEKSRQWAIRCVHEASLYENNCFITLTYNDEHLPWYVGEDDLTNPGTLELSDYQKFMKRLRRRYGKGIRFYHCGEYGEKENRPHYHALIFNHDFKDKQLWTIRGDNRLYISEELNSLWVDDEGKSMGFASIGDVTFESAAYVARYIVKKQTGPAAEAHYDGRKPEYTTMSRRPGIGGAWIQENKNDVYQQGMDAHVVLNGMKLTPPKFYLEKLKNFDPEHYDEIYLEKSKNTLAKEKESSYDRLKSRETVQLAKLKQLKREI